MKLKLHSTEFEFHFQSGVRVPYSSATKMNSVRRIEQHLDLFRIDVALSSLKKGHDNCYYLQNNYGSSIMKFVPVF